MATILESLKSVSGYPVPESTISDVAIKRGLNLAEVATPVVLNSSAYRLARADILRWVSFAPNVQQADVRYDLLFSDREQLRKQANAIYCELGDEAYIDEESKTKFGYKGSKL
jgi:hypothetical protein